MKDFRVNLLPKRKENKLITTIFLMVAVFVVFSVITIYLFYLPLKLVNAKILKNEVELQNIQLKNEKYQNQLQQINLDRKDIIYRETIELINLKAIDTAIVLNDIDSFITNDYDIIGTFFDAEEEQVAITIETLEDVQLLLFVRKLRTLAWAKSVDFRTSGSGKHEIIIDLQVGDTND